MTNLRVWWDIFLKVCKRGWGWHCQVSTSGSGSPASLAARVSWRCISCNKGFHLEHIKRLSKCRMQGARMIRCYLFEMCSFLFSSRKYDAQSRCRSISKNKIVFWDMHNLFLETHSVSVQARLTRPTPLHTVRRCEFFNDHLLVMTSMSVLAHKFNKQSNMLFCNKVATILEHLPS